MRADGGAGADKRSGFRNKTTIAVLSGSLAVLPMLAVSDATVRWLDVPEQEQAAPAPLAGGQPPASVSVNGSLPEAPPIEKLWAPVEPVTGSLGIPSTALEAYKRAAERAAAEYPGCNIDWALLASIGRIESNHARGGYVDGNGDARETILGPVLDGTGDVAAIPDTDGGAYDGDTRWDRAVGPMQFIPSTWKRYASDGNGDGVADPNNLYDSTLAAARYLCSGGVDLSDPEQLRAALYRYNNSWSYVNTVIRWAKAYRSGVSALPDSDVPTAVLVHASNPVKDESSVTRPSPEPPTKPTRPETPEKPDGPDAPTPEDPPPSDGEDPPPSDGEDPPPGDGEDSPPSDGEDPPPGDGEDSPPSDGEDPPPGDGEDPPPSDGEDPPPGDGEDPPPSDGEDPPPSDGEDPPGDGEDPADPGECDPEEEPEEPEEPSSFEPTGEQPVEQSSSEAASTGEPTESDESTDPPCDDESDDDTEEGQPEPTSGTTPSGASATREQEPTED